MTIVNVLYRWRWPKCSPWSEVILNRYHYIVICTLVTIFNWWLSSEDMKLRVVLINEALVASLSLTHVLYFVCIYMALFVYMYIYLYVSLYMYIYTIEWRHSNLIRLHCMLVTGFNWWLSSKDIRKEVKTKEAIVVFHDSRYILYGSVHSREGIEHPFWYF